MRQFFKVKLFNKLNFSGNVFLPGWPRRPGLLAMTESKGYMGLQIFNILVLPTIFFAYKLFDRSVQPLIPSRHGEEPRATWPSRNFNILIVVMIFVLTGCGSLTGINSAESRLSHGWSDVIEEDMTNQRPLYCYKTIGAVDCYEHPIAERRDQLVTQYPAPLKNRRHRKIWSLADDSDFNHKVEQSYKENERQGHPAPMTPHTVHGMHHPKDHGQSYPQGSGDSNRPTQHHNFKPAYPSMPPKSPTSGGYQKPIQSSKGLDRQANAPLS